MGFENPPPEEIRALLARVRHVAVVGFSSRPARASHNIARQLQRFGFHVIPVRPGLAEGLGERAYPDLGAVEGPIDLVDVFRAAEHVPAIVDDCIRLGLRALWLQDGVVHEQAALRAREAGIAVVMDRCIMRDYTRLCRA